VIFPSRHRKNHDAYLEWKVRLFFAGALVALAGMALASSWLVGAGILILLSGAALRFLPGRGAGSSTSGGEPGGEPPGREDTPPD